MGEVDTLVPRVQVPILKSRYVTRDR